MSVNWEREMRGGLDIKEGSEVVKAYVTRPYAKRGNIQLIADKIELISILGELER